MEVMKKRRSVRNFSSEPISKESLERITNAGILAPSGADMLPFTFVLIQDQQMKERIREESEKVDVAFHEGLREGLKGWMKAKKITDEKPFLTQAPVLLVVSGDTSMPYWLESTWISIAYMALAIESEGLSSLTYTPTETGFLNGLLDIPNNFSPQVILPIGHTLERLEPKKSRPHEKVFWERHGCEKTY